MFGLRSATAVCVTLSLFVGLCARVAQAEIEGRYRVHRVRGGPIEGYVRELPNAYEVEVRPGIRMKIPKTQVLRLEPLEARTSDAAAKAGRAADPLHMPVSDEEIEQILGQKEFDLEALAGIEEVDLMAPLTTDRQSVQEMLRIAGRNARTLETDHFVVVYTSSTEKARQLASRLEHVYAWCVQYMKLLDLPRTQRPAHRLEIFFFGTFEEYDRYQTLNGFREMGFIGFYYRPYNRSAFFDMMTYPPYRSLLERSKDPEVPLQERRRAKNLLERLVEHQNLEVVQHEAAHHIHFNIGIFPGKADLPRWMTEGLATMFEVPPNRTGASLGSLNHVRLYRFREFFGPRGENAPPLREFISDDAYFGGYRGYLMGWALNHYLFHKKREQYAEWMRLLANLEDNVPFTQAQRLAEFERIFGEVNEQWEKEFKDYIASLRVRRSFLPPEIP